MPLVKWVTNFCFRLFHEYHSLELNFLCAFSLMLENSMSSSGIHVRIFFSPRKIGGNHVKKALYSCNRTEAVLLYHLGLVAFALVYNNDVAPDIGARSHNHAVHVAGTG